jgi:hypothetical protein
MSFHMKNFKQYLPAILQRVLVLHNYLFKIFRCTLKKGFFFSKRQHHIFHHLQTTKHSSLCQFHYFLHQYNQANNSHRVPFHHRHKTNQEVPSSASSTSLFHHFHHLRTTNNAQQNAELILMGAVTIETTFLYFTKHA